jgi:catechol 2,3-dioxygenase-like lactoylglutathione lyase family enzyme
MAIQPDMIGIVVSDMAAALRFYRMLGLAVPEGVEGQDHVEVITPNGYRIAWDTEALMRGIDADWVVPQASRVGLAFKCDGPADVDARYAEITAAGYLGVKEPWDAFWGQRYAVVSDPDGLHIDLFAAL